MLEFMECPFCSKSIRKDAEQCHRCGRSLDEELADQDPWGCPEHADGGYDSEDEWDEAPDSSTENSSPSMFRVASRLWFFVAWLMVFVFLLPFVLQAIEIFFAPI